MKQIAYIFIFKEKVVKIGLLPGYHCPQGSTSSQILINMNQYKPSRCYRKTFTESAGKHG